MDHLQDGCIYLVEEERMDKAVDVFLEAVRPKDGRGLIITRQSLESIDPSFGLSAFPTYRLSMNHHRPDNLSPHNIGELTQLIVRFTDLRRQGVILLEGLEYLATQTNFPSMLRWIQFIGDNIAGSRCIIVLSMNPLAFLVKDLHLLKSESYKLPPTITSEITEKGLVARASRV